eukprot:982591-Pleurochrysis_carterae.AAC.1
MPKHATLVSCARNALAVRVLLARPVRSARFEYLNFPPLRFPSMSTSLPRLHALFRFLCFRLLFALFIAAAVCSTVPLPIPLFQQRG